MRSWQTESARVMYSTAAGDALTAWVPVGHSAAPAAAQATLPMADTGDKALVGTAVVDAASGQDGARAAVDRAMDRYAAGDDAAFDELHRLAAPRVRGFLLRMCGSMDLAEDLLQDTFLHVCAARGSFEEQAPAYPWLLAIARNLLVDHTRRARHRPSAGGEAAGARSERRAPADTQGDEALAGREMLEVVRAALDRMTVAQREAFVLVRFEGLTAKEAAHVLGATATAVKIRAFRAYEALRAALRDNGFGTE